MPFEKFISLYGLDNPYERVADLGCGPADILRYLSYNRMPAFYLGVDISKIYLDAARRRADSIGIRSRFINLDLTRLTSDEAVQNQLVNLLEEERITRVLLLGVLHHIPDDAAVLTLNLIRRASCVTTVITQDVIVIENKYMNNILCQLDRGQHVRTESGYDQVARHSRWDGYHKKWTSPGLWFIKYIHYIFKKNHSQEPST